MENFDDVLLFSNEIRKVSKSDANEFFVNGARVNKTNTIRVNYAILSNRTRLIQPKHGSRLQ